MMELTTILLIITISSIVGYEFGRFMGEGHGTGNE